VIIPLYIGLCYASGILKYCNVQRILFSKVSANFHYVTHFEVSRDNNIIISLQSTKLTIHNMNIINQWGKYCHGMTGTKIKFHTHTGSQFKCVHVSFAVTVHSWKLTRGCY